MPNASPKSYQQCQREFADECRRLAREAFRRACTEGYQPFYLAGTKRAGLDTHNPQAAIWERFSVATEAQVDAYGLVTVRPEPLPCHHLTLGHLADVIREWLSREPLAIFGD